MMKEINASIKIRLYPAKNQLELLERHFGASRFVYNYFLDFRKKEYLTRKESEGVIEYENCSKHLTEMKKKEEYSWMREVDSTCLQQSIINLDTAYKRFFNKLSNFPTFKSKHDNHQSYRIAMMQSVQIDWINQTIKLPKFKALFKFGGSCYRNLVRFTSITISKTSTGKFYASITGIYQIDEKDKSEKIIGIDLGLKDLIIDSSGNRIENPRFLKRKLKKLKFLQRKHSKSKKGSSRKNKKRIILARQHEKVVFARKDYLHKVTSKLIDENQVICMEDLAVKNMIKNHNLAQAISDVSWGTLVSFVKYKSEWYGRSMIKIDRFFPSSKTCSSCGWINKELKLSDREWNCSSCDVIHDRDHNAAKNILTQGLNLLSGCGTQSDIKQKPQEASGVPESMNEEAVVHDD